MRSYFYVALTILLTVYGQIIIKARATALGSTHGGWRFLSTMFLDVWVLSGLISAVAASATWMMAVRTTQLSLVYPIMALTFVFVPLLAVLAFGEKLSSVQLAGLCLIVIGVGLSAIRL